MGALYFIIYPTRNPKINLEYIKSFMNMKNRGEFYSKIEVEESVDITRVNPMVNIKRYLTRDEIQKYRQMSFVYGYHRMSVNDFTFNGMQPFEDPIQNQISRYPELKGRVKRKLMCNGEIYNYNKLREENGFGERDLQSECDVEIILPLYIKYGIENTIKMIDGEYSFILTENLETFDYKNMNIYVASDFIGTRPLYMVKSYSEPLFYLFTTELKSVCHITDPDLYINEFPIGSYWEYKTGEIKSYVDWEYYKDINNCEYVNPTPDILRDVYGKIRETLVESVLEKYKMTECGVGILLSGGYSSALLTSIIARHVSSKVVVFTLIESDKERAERVIELLESKYKIEIEHHFVDYKDINMINEDIEEIVWANESMNYDLISKSICYYYLFKYIKMYTDIKVLLLGDGLNNYCINDELDDRQYQKESVNKMISDGREILVNTDKLSGWFGLETRYPYISQSCFELILKIHPKLKRSQYYNTVDKIDKYIIRKAFDMEGYLPSELTWTKSKLGVDEVFKNELDRLLCSKSKSGDCREYIKEVYNKKFKFV